MKNWITDLADKIIISSFYLLFFLVPLVLTPINYELFEYNKMMATYGLTVVIVGAWIIKMIARREISIKRTPLDIPLVLFLASQIISTIFSMDRHVSLWGYYSRFNGGLLSVISYFFLYYAFVTNFPKEKIKKLLSVILVSGVLVSIYGILEHFGIDRDLWVQDVQNRVFSTLGQPNWLAAYLAVLIPIALGIGLQNISNQYADFVDKSQKPKFKTIGLLDNWMIACLPARQGLLVFITSAYYVTLVFTKSRSGFIGFWISLIVFWFIPLFSVILIKFQSQKVTHMQAVASICVKINRLIGIMIASFIFITFFLGTPFPQINRFTYSELFKNNQQPTTNNISTPLSASPQPIKPLGSSIIDVGITESGKIRSIVWRGAVDIFRHYPVFGTGVETFAFAYYKFRPIEHNMTSEWDFLYNKAHNEYLNYAATTGSFGIGSYLLIIAGFLWWNINKLKVQSRHGGTKFKAQNNLDFGFDLNIWILNFGFFASWLSILITNFFGFSVVLIQLFFFLIPAISFVLSDETTSYVLFSFSPKPSNRNNGTMKPFNNETINTPQKLLIPFLLSVICYLLFVIARLWYADTVFTYGYHLAHTQEADYLSAYKSLKEAVSLNSNEPFYFDELSFPAVMLSVALYDEKLATASSQLKDEAILASDIAISISPNNVNFWKSRTRVFYTLSQIDEKYTQEAQVALVKAHELSPTDPKISYNLALIYDRLGKRNEAKEQLLQTVKLKQDYKDAYIALGLYHELDKEKDKAKEIYNFILTRLDKNDENVKKRLEELK